MIIRNKYLKVKANKTLPLPLQCACSGIQMRVQIQGVVTLLAISDYSSNAEELEQSPPKALSGEKQHPFTHGRGLLHTLPAMATHEQTLLGTNKDYEEQCSFTEATTFSAKCCLLNALFLQARS